MTAPRVWSEREEGTWYACVYAAYLSALVVAGHARYPFGAFTNAERWAFEAAQTLKPQGVSGNFTAADQASLTRYGLALRSATELAALLDSPGLVLAVAGANTRLVPRLRRWQPSYTGGHAAAIVTLGPAGLLWLDPLAPMGYAGEPISRAELLAWWNRNPVRYLAQGELLIVVITITEYDVPWRAITPPGTVVTLYKPGAAVKRFTVGPAGSSVMVVGSAEVAPLPAGWPSGELRVTADGYLLAAASPGLRWDPPPNPCAAAIAARDSDWRQALGRVTP